MQRRFSYKKCMQALNDIVCLSETQLPPIQGKESAMRAINKYFFSHKRPILYRYMPTNNYTKLSIENDDIYMVPASNMNDVFEGAAFGTFSSEEANENGIKQVQENVYLKSFSYDKNNNLMWSHYGDAHKGICVGYDFKKVRESVLEHLYPVQYSNTRFSNAYAEKIGTHPFLCLRKSTCWKYEKEFRLIYTSEDLPESSKKVKMDCICEIQFGLRTSQQEIESIKKLVHDKCKNIKLYQTKQKKDSFVLTREEICHN